MALVCSPPRIGSGATAMALVAQTSLHFVQPLQLFRCTTSMLPSAFALKFLRAHALMHLPQLMHLSTLIRTLNPVGLIP